MLCTNFWQAFKNVLLKKSEISVNNIGTFTLGYYRAKDIMHPIYKKIVLCFPFRKIFFKQSDEMRVFLNSHERYVKRPIFNYSDKKWKSSQEIVKKEYEEFVKSYVKYQKLKFLDNITFEEYVKIKEKE